MKRSILSFCAALLAVTASAQEWKLVPVWSDLLSTTYLSYGQPVGEEEPFFSLWGYRFYDEESSSCFETEYFRGDAPLINEFLSGVCDFAERNSSEQAVAVICGTKVKTFKHPVTGIYVCVFNGSDFCMYKTKKWREVYDSFITFCRKNDIAID